MRITSPPGSAVGIDRLLDRIGEAAIRVTASGTVIRWNAPAAQRFPDIAADGELTGITPPDLVERIGEALASDAEEIVLEGFGARVLRLGDDDRLLLFDTPELEIFNDLPAGMLVWEYDGDELRSASDMRLIAANVASETLGPRFPLRSLIGRTRGEIGPIDVLTPLYMQVARTGEPAEMEVADVKGNPFVARILPLKGRRLGVIFEDVTVLRQTEQSVRAMFERAHDAILIFDPHSEEILEANPVALQLYRSFGENIVGRKLTELSRESQPGIGARVLREGFIRYEDTLVEWGGRQVRLDIHATPVERRGMTAVMAIVRDVTNQMEALQALLSSEAKYRTLVENMPVVLWTIHRAGTVFVSPRAERIMGYTPEEIMTPEFGPIWGASVHPDDLPHALAAYEALFREGTPFEIEYRFHCKNGQWKWVSDQALHTYEKDGLLLASGVSQDITERKRAESQQVALAGFGRRALTSSDELALMNDACRTIIDVLEVSSANVLLLDPLGNAFTIAAGTQFEIMRGQSFPNEDTRLPSVTLASNEPIVYTDLETENRFFTGVLRGLGTRSGIAAPIVGRAARYGILSAHTSARRAFGERDAAFVQSMANILAEAIEGDRAERELERQKAQLSDAQALAHIGSLQFDRETRAVECSDELYRIFGMRPQSQPMTAEFLVSRVAPEDRARVERLSSRVDAGELIDEECVIHGMDGVARIGHYRAWSMTNRANGKPIIVGTLQDVTAARQAEATLRDSERRLQVIVSKLPVMLFSADAHLHLTSITGEGVAGIANGESELMLDALIGPWPESGGPAVALAGRDTTYDTRRGDRDLRVHIEPLRDDQTQTIAGIVGIAFDATEEKRAEEANRMLLERVHDAARQWRDTFDSIRAPILIVDENVRVRRMNGAALGFSRFKDYLAALDQPVASLGDAKIWVEIDELVRKAHRQNDTVALQHVDSDNRVWDLLASWGQGQAVVIVTEVTEVVRMHESLQRAQQMSEMGALVAGVAHEVRNPLFGISATLDAFESRFGAGEFPEYVDALREQVDRMSQLMHELLEYGRPVASELHPQFLTPLLQRALNSMEPLARQREVALRSTIRGVLPQVAMDRQRLLQVFENLLKNAIEHSEPGGVVNLMTEVGEDPTDVSIVVQDQGPGFSEEELPRIFEPFFTRRRGGTGLGLSLARRIVHDHHGTVRASNCETGGASVVVTLPAAEAMEAS